MGDNSTVLTALSRQIAEDLLESSKQACTVKPHNIKNVLHAGVITKIVSDLSKNRGKYVKFKEVPMAVHAFDLLPKFVQKNRVDAKLDEKIKTKGFNTLMETICAPASDESPAPPDDEIMMMRLTTVAKHIILDYLNDDLDYLNETFELNPSTGGRKQKSRRGHKQKSRRKQRSRRGHKTRRHKRRSMRKH